MPFDPNRAAMEKYQNAILVESLMRVEAVANYYAARGNKVLFADDDEIRAFLKMSPNEKVADVLIETGPGQLVIAEVKGNNLKRAIDQLRNTADRAAHLYKRIVCKIYVRNPVPKGDSVDLIGGWGGYRAVRVFHASFPGEWILYEYDPTHAPLPVRAGSEQVCVVFGPHV
jgi:ribosome-associated translation inhibitor RaiA